MSLNSDTCPTVRPSGSSDTAALSVAVVATLLAAVGRVVPHPFNMSLVGALGLFAGARLRLWLALVFPVTAMIISDLILWRIWDYSPFNPFAYGSFVVYVLLGFYVRRTHSFGWIGLACLAGSVQFFLVTNLSHWHSLAVDPASMPDGKALVWENAGAEHASPMPRYARNLEGLLACYRVALPVDNPDAPALGFFGNALLGDVLGCVLLFGIHGALVVVLMRRAEARVRRDS